jgi:hypothetical protein
VRLGALLFIVGTIWSRPCRGTVHLPPIEWSKGKRLVTLRDAALYITKLPKAEHDAEEWQAAMEALLLVAERDGPTMFARIGVMRALNRHVERVPRAFGMCHRNVFSGGTVRRMSTSKEPSKTSRT